MSDPINTLQTDPTCLLEGSVDSSDVLQLVKSLFDPITKGNSVLDEIYVEGLDASQVWPQTKIILESVTESLLFEKIPTLKESYGTKLTDLEEISEEDISDDHDEQDEQDDQDSEEDIEEDEENPTFPEGEEDSEIEDFDPNGPLIDDYVEEDLESGQDNDDDDDDDEQEEQEEDDDDDDTPKFKKDKFGLNDEFFSIDDFNKMTSEDTGLNDDDDEIDYFGDLGESEDEEVAYYDDFFGKPSNKKKEVKQQQQKKKNPSKKEKKLKEGSLNEDDFDDGMKSAMMDLFADEDEPQVEEEEEVKPEKNLSSFERQQLQIQQEIAKLEKEAIAEKKWAMKGEAKAKDRPQDALLDEELEFERTAKPVPVITKEVTESLEEMIRRRIKEANFDDLPRRVITDVTNFRSSSSFELSDQKSSKSLAELYEDEYKGDQSENAVSEELQKAHDEIKDMFKSLSYKLDALSSAHFIPKPAQKAIDIKVNAPTITMEDAQPLTQSSASTLAPQEIYKASNSADSKEIQLKSGTVFSRDELSREDKQRMRRANKRKRARDAFERDAAQKKKSKKQDVLDTLSKAKNVTVIDNKGQRRDVAGNVKKDKIQQGTSGLKL
ncbi:CYFA0S19e00870g1_1 [Cyberlindnera fabianii]|uniref:U3 small nucleolar ribonucleoprotein protein MPP10 n=1 Tax=Cyberlindnera fabianii TaxID=36022 RepID=A0A061BCL5_CYBFA|nr:CYFA0S19e00870g1_1 [Cyberlindnera fabianii]